LDEAESEFGGSGLEVLNLPPAVLGLVEFDSSIDVFHPVTQYAVNQSCELGGHGLDGNGCAESGSQSTELRSQIGVARP
jgi:hypothetical protein